MLVWFAIASLVLLIIGVAHCAGRLAGLAEGRRLALLEAYLVVREDALRAGECPICGACCGRHRVSS